MPNIIKIVAIEKEKISYPDSDIAPQKYKTITRAYIGNTETEDFLSSEKSSLSISSPYIRKRHANGFAFGAPAEIRTRNSAVGGRRFIQLDYGCKNIDNIFKYIIF